MHNKEPTENVAHWNKLFDGLTYSPDTFYEQVSQKLGARRIPGLEMRKVTFKEKGSFSANRIYLRIMRDGLIFDICAAPYGEGAFFVSAWTGAREVLGCMGWLWSILLFFPLVGMFAERNADPWTYYRIDSLHMFQEVVHLALLETIDEITSTAKIPPLTPEERKANLKNLANI